MNGRPCIANPLAAVNWRFAPIIADAGTCGESSILSHVCCAMIDYFGSSITLFTQATVS
jgi:hypothetical protein